MYGFTLPEHVLSEIERHNHWDLRTIRCSVEPADDWDLDDDELEEEVCLNFD
jgi:hypothetical protein